MERRMVAKGGVGQWPSCRAVAASSWRWRMAPESEERQERARADGVVDRWGPWIEWEGKLLSGATSEIIQCSQKEAKGQSIKSEGIKNKIKIK